MKRKGLGDAMRKSLHDEEQGRAESQRSRAISRMSRASEVLGEAEPTQETPAPKSEKPRKVVKDGFSFPAEEHEVIDEVRDRISERDYRLRPSKSEVVRMGLAAIGAFSGADLEAAYRGLSKVSTGRRPKS